MELTLIYTFQYRDYRETAGYSSLDSRQHELKFNTGYKLDRSENHAVDIEFAYRARRYVSYPGRGASGDRMPEYPLKKYNYFTVSPGYIYSSRKFNSPVAASAATSAARIKIKKIPRFQFI